ncbi:cutinase family protein, partial [Mycobacterium tuberculosis]
MNDLLTRRLLTMGAAAAMLAAVLLLTPITVPAGYPGAVAPATAACPDAEVVFARGRFEPPGIGTVGNAFVSALRSKVNKNVGVYAVKYPADNQIDVGANDMSAHIQSMANSCPNTRLVPGGYSLGAAVTDVVLAVPTQMCGFTEAAKNAKAFHDKCEKHVRCRTYRGATQICACVCARNRTK